ncbi:lactoylglutathione lyase [Sphingobium sufflavum]|uniref:VOC family protein n=1 Tax=Sphingobium sufflavum TaxID=1129547 RepID=UPI001F2BC0B9|nr:VOC family protein [Sphingobium sufflavum]MCE7795276.1 lactoylglutathione lyase [Sphingobium sufflavum]
MTRMIFVNLPVTDLPRSLAFYQAVGATPDPRFADDSAAAISFTDTIHAMLLTHARFASFTTRTIIDAHHQARAAFCLSEESREAVDSRVRSAVAAGGTADPNPVQDHGFLYSRSYADPDGHIWEPMWMDVEAAMAAGANQQAPEPAA